MPDPKCVTERDRFRQFPGRRIKLSAKTEHKPLNTEDRFFDPKRGAAAMKLPASLDNQARGMNITFQCVSFGKKNVRLRQPVNIFGLMSRPMSPALFASAARSAT